MKCNDILIRSMCLSIYRNKYMYEKNGIIEVIDTMCLIYVYVFTISAPRNYIEKNL